MRQRVSILLALTLVGIGCTSGKPALSVSASSPKPAAVETGSSLADLRNGKTLYFTGRDLAGRKMTAQGQPLFNRCVDCHRADGSGGRHFPDGAISADLRPAALIAHQRHPYTMALLQRAIATGIDNEGHPLDPVMPRWRLTARDLRDVAQYVLNGVNK